MSWHPHGRYLRVDGRRTHVVDVGQGPPILLLHGFLHSSWTWRETIAALSARHRVIAPDLPGFGWGDRVTLDFSLDGITAWALALLDALGVEALLGGVGNSLGGAVLLDMALRRPERVGRLVLVSPLAAPLKLPTLPLRILGLRPFGPLFRATAGNRSFVKRALAWTAYRDRAVDDEVLYGFAHLRRSGSHRAAVLAARQLKAASRSISQRVGALTTPATVVWGQKDLVLPLRYGERVAALMPEAEFRVFDRCGHCPQEEDPERFQRLLSSVLALPPEPRLSLPSTYENSAPEG